MMYLVEVKAGMERANEIDKGEGPGPVFQKIAERFKPQSVWGNPSRRQAIMVVDLKTPADMAELMYALTWWAGGEPTFTPIMPPETYGEAISAAKKIATPP
jgi:hypothetical protein